MIAITFSVADLEALFLMLNRLTRGIVMDIIYTSIMTSGFIVIVENPSFTGKTLAETFLLHRLKLCEQF